MATLSGITGVDSPRTLVVPGLLNFRDLGGTPTTTGRPVQPRRLWRSENQTGLASTSLQDLIGRGLTDIVDLRTDFEVAGSPSPWRCLPRMRYHHFSFFREAEDDHATILDRALPWVGHRIEELTGDETADSYLGFLSDRPDSVVGGLRAIADAPGAALVHCAVGKDRTGFLVALALSLVGVADADIAADYARTTEAIVAVVERLWTDPTYATEASDIDEARLAARPETMATVLDHLHGLGGIRPLLRDFGWTDDDDRRLAHHLLAR